MESEEHTSYPDRTYHVVTVEKTDPPTGIDEGDWYQYVIARADETIVGNRRGTLKEVTQHANEYAENLSARVSSGKPYWSATARNKK
jgi:hypothetical protein